MLVLYFAPRTRAARVLWLLEELDLPYQLERVEFDPPTDKFFQQATPTGKLPTLVDGDIVMFESGAILEYVLERYGEGRLAPAPGSPERAAYLQWFHYAESTAFPPLGILVWLTRYRDGNADLASLIEDTRKRSAAGLEYLERHMAPDGYLVGEFSAADIMMGFTLLASRVLGVLDERYPRLGTYLERLGTRPALQKVMSIE